MKRRRRRRKLKHKLRRNGLQICVSCKGIDLVDQSRPVHEIRGLVESALQEREGLSVNFSTAYLMYM